MHRHMLSGLLALLFSSTAAHAATLGIPGQNATLSGIGVISGWKCTAGTLTVRFDGGTPIPLVYGSQRPDVLRAGACPHDRVGFVAIMNWGNLEDGQHTAVVYDNGVEFARSVFWVSRFREAFVRNAAATVSVADFPEEGETSVFAWTEATQHLELADTYGAPQQTTLPGCEGWTNGEEDWEGTTWSSLAWIRQCLEAGADPNARDTRGWMPLFHATYYNEPEAVLLLLEAGASLNAYNTEGRSLLHHVLWFSNPHEFEILVLLLERGVDPNARDSEGTPVFHYLHEDHGDTERLFLRFGADPNLQDGGGRTYGCTTFECLEKKNWRRK